MKSCFRGISRLTARCSPAHPYEGWAFEKIYAPFDGVITARNTDIGDLISAGVGGPKELLHMAAVSRLRIYVSVPEADLSIVLLGGHVDLMLDEYPDRTFQGTIVRTSDDIDQTPRTLNVEIDIDNTKDEIKTGAYVLAHFRSSDPKIRSGKNLMIPANAVLFRLKVCSIRKRLYGWTAVCQTSIHRFPRVQGTPTSQRNELFELESGESERSG